MSGSERRNVVVLGKGSLAARVATWFLEHQDWELAVIVPALPEPTWTESLTGFALRKGVPVVESGDYRDVPSGVPIDLAMSVFYDKVIDAAFLAACGRALNVHNGPLPRYRGVLPINWALKNEERVHGVTIHELTPELDRGPIVAQATYSIYPELEEVEDVYWRSLEFGWLLFVQTMPLLDRIQPWPQDELRATYYSVRDASRLGDRRGHTRTDRRHSTSPPDLPA